MTEQPSTPAAAVGVSSSETADALDDALDDAPADDVVVPIRRLDPDLDPPAYAQPGDAGADLRATVDVFLAPGARALVGTGVAIALPRGYAGFVHPRSGLAARHGVSIVNAPGTVDADYRGEIKVCLINCDPDTAVLIRRGDRIAQLVVQQVSRARFVPVESLSDTVRGAGGHGSTGGMPLDLSGSGPDVRPSTPRHSQELSG